MADRELPKGVYFKHGAYYLVKNNKWTRLGKTLDADTLAILNGDVPKNLVKSYLTGKIASMRSGAKRRGLCFEITADDLESLIERQEFQCAITGIRFDMKRYPDLRIPPYAPSVDRINHKIGYTRENIQIVCSAVNVARSNLPDEIFMHIMVAGGIRLASRLD